MKLELTQIKTMEKVKNKLFIIILLFLCSCQFAEPTDFVLNSKEEGRYAIVYDCENGIAENYVDGRLQHIFPENNILVVSYPKTSGIVDYRFYYYENGKKIEFFMPTHKKSDNSFLAFGPTRTSTITYDKDMFYFGKDYEDKNNKDFFDFARYVDNYIKEQGLKCGKNR